MFQYSGFFRVTKIIHLRKMESGDIFKVLAIKCPIGAHVLLKLNFAIELIQVQLNNLGIARFNWRMKEIITLMLLQVCQIESLLLVKGKGLITCALQVTPSSVSLPHFRFCLLLDSLSYPLNFDSLFHAKYFQFGSFQIKIFYPLTFAKCWATNGSTQAFDKLKRSLSLGFYGFIFFLRRW